MYCDCYPGMVMDGDHPMWILSTIFLITTNLYRAVAYTNNGNGLVTLPPDIPLNTTHINLDNNAFELLPPSAYSNFPGLRVVSMRNNLLTRH